VRSAEGGRESSEVAIAKYCLQLTRTFGTAAPIDSGFAD
jgi:hypothetical protein